ncbi:MAG TPA: trypsin-like peptidase domain-containing protein [Anaerolineales bacterium]|nr:trypsin-like peptidase domain-containing protein [Anaerolineales bacterium]
MAIDKNTLAVLSESLVDAVEKAGKSTVLVNARHRFPASGIAYGQDLVLTADHVVERDENISVISAEGETVQATVAGRDPGNDLALLRLDKAGLTPAEKSDQEAKVGQLVVALGRPSQDGIEASLGIVSAVGGPARTGRGGLLERYLRTDAVPLPGFSGGPLVDMAGRVVGLNTSGLAHGAAITIPAFLAWADAQNLATYGYVKRGYLGIRSQLVELSSDLAKPLGREQATGLLLVSVEKGSPAEAGGLMVGDILVAINHHPTSDHDELMAQLSGEIVGKPILVQVLRGGQAMEMTVTAGERK